MTVRSIKLLLGALLLPVLTSCESREGSSLADKGLEEVRPLILAADQVIAYGVPGIPADEDPPLSENRLVLTQNQRREIDRLILDRNSYLHVTADDLAKTGSKDCLWDPEVALRYESDEGELMVYLEAWCSRVTFKGVTILDCDPVGEELKEVVQGLLDDLS